MSSCRGQPAGKVLGRRAGDAAGMQSNTTCRTAGGVDPEELPFENGSFDAVISNGVVNLSADKRRVFSEAARVLRPGGRLALADIVTERQIAPRTLCQADLWAACIAGASQRDLYLADIAATGLELQVVHTNPAYRFASERAQRTSDKYGAHSVSLLALKPPHRRSTR